jgi:hypothetical protein
MHDTAMPSNFQPIACSLTGDDLAAQARRWHGLRARAGVAHSEVDDGIRLTFRDDQGVEEELRALVGVENACCAWAEWSVGHENGLLVMRARSSGAGVAALHGMLHMPD